MKSLFASATNTLKQNNQDYSSIVINEEVGFIGVIVADGIGSHYKSELSSKFCVTKLKEKLEALSKEDAIDFHVFFNEIKSSLIEYSENSNDLIRDGINKAYALGTTLICALELENEFLIAYSGNGSIWYTKGDFNKFSANRYLPWNSINLLNPHSKEQEGREALYRYISISDACCSPTILQISKDKIDSGDILIITTDGIYSYDQIPIGKDENDVIWIKSEESMPLLYRSLSLFLENNPKETKHEDLEFSLNAYLGTLKEKNLIHDDTTIGLIITEEAINFHQQIWEKQNATILNEKNTSS